MIGKVKYIERSVWSVEAEDSVYKHDTHAIRHTNTYAVLYNRDKVDIDEDDIRNFYSCSKITNNIIAKLNNNLHNVKIEYSDCGGNYYLDGKLSDYITNDIHD